MKPIRMMLFVAVLSLAAASLANIVINPLVEDIFSSCIQQTGPEPTVECEYGTQFVYAGLAGIFLMLFAAVYGVKNGTIFKTHMAALIAGPAYIIARIITWRLYLRLPQRQLGLEQDYFRDYLDVSFLIVAGLLAGIMTALFAVSSGEETDEDGNTVSVAGSFPYARVTALSLIVVAGASWLARNSESDFTDIGGESTYSYEFLLIALPVILSGMLIGATFMIWRNSSTQATTKSAKTATKKSAAKSASTVAKKKTPAKKVAATKASPTKKTAKKTTAKKTVAKKTVTKKAAPKKSAAKKTTAKKTTSKKTTSKSTAAKKKPAAKKTTTRSQSSSRSTSTRAKSTAKKKPATKKK